MAAPTNRESDKFIVRLPDGMRERIKAAAEANNRSMNAEIVATLEREYPAPRSSDEFLRDVMAHLDSLPAEERPRKLESMIRYLEWPTDLPPNVFALLRRLYDDS